ncbi:MAG: YjbH domain-containing protein [Ignavibacteriales bacterium]|nr:YjbH domain-containing protein [Ignavibacteriales bacterium]
MSISTSAQGTAGENAKFEQRYLIDMPTAGVLSKGMVAFSTELLPYGTLIAKIDAGILENFNLGISYGGSNIIGSGDINWYAFPPGLNLRLKLFNESKLMPAISIGFDTQGKGEYYDDEKRYDTKAPGIFAAVSKNFSVLGYLSLHGLVDYSILEDNDGDNFINFMVEQKKL